MPEGRVVIMSSTASLWGLRQMRGPAVPAGLGNPVLPDVGVHRCSACATGCDR